MDTDSVNSVIDAVFDVVFFGTHEETIKSIERQKTNPTKWKASEDWESPLSSAVRMGNCSPAASANGFV